MNSTRADDGDDAGRRDPVSASVADVCTGRTVARIFHGINSPAFPTSFWKESEYWKRYARYNFDQVLALCNRVAVTSRRALEADQR